MARRSEIRRATCMYARGPRGEPVDELVAALLRAFAPAPAGTPDWSDVLARRRALPERRGAEPECGGWGTRPLRGGAAAEVQLGWGTRPL